MRRSVYPLDIVEYVFAKLNRRVNVLESSVSHDVESNGEHGGLLRGRSGLRQGVAQFVR